MRTLKFGVTGAGDGAWASAGGRGKANVVIVASARMHVGLLQPSRPIAWPSLLRRAGQNREVGAGFVRLARVLVKAHVRRAPHAAPSAPPRWRAPPRSTWRR